MDSYYKHLPNIPTDTTVKIFQLVLLNTFTLFNNIWIILGNQIRYFDTISQGEH